MLISPEEISKYFKIHPEYILHVGAHQAEEVLDYEKAGWASNGEIHWVESQPKLVDNLKKTLDQNKHKIYCATVWSISGEEMSFNIASNSQSSSLLNFGSHNKTYPEITFIDSLTVKTKRLDELIEKNLTIDFVNLDIQGAELQALIGLGEKLTSVKFIYSEVNRKNVYEDCAKISDLDNYLKSYGFQRVATRWVPKAGWGDAFWINRHLTKKYRRPMVAYRMREMVIISKRKRTERSSRIKRIIKRFIKPHKVN